MHDFGRKDISALIFKSWSFHSRSSKKRNESSQVQKKTSGWCIQTVLKNYSQLISSGLTSTYFWDCTSALVLDLGLRSWRTVEWRNSLRLSWFLILSELLRKNGNARFQSRFVISPCVGTCIGFYSRASDCCIYIYLVGRLQMGARVLLQPIPVKICNHVNFVNT